MPWIELHSNLREHPKTASIVESMGLADADHAVGKLSRLWLWALEYASDGNLDRFTVTQLAVASGVDPKDADRWRESLVAARWLDTSPRLRIHDWWEYAGYYLRKRFERKPERWKEIEKAYLDGDTGPPCGDAAETQRTRSGHAASTLTRPNQPTRPTGGNARASLTGELSTATEPKGRQIGADAPPPLEKKPSNTELIVREKELVRIEKRLAEILNGYEGHQSPSAAHRSELAKLRARREELKQLLGLCV